MLTIKTLILILIFHYTKNIYENISADDISYKMLNANAGVSKNI